MKAALTYSKARLYANDELASDYNSFFNYSKTSEFLFLAYENFCKKGFVEINDLKTLNISQSTIYNYIKLAIEYKILRKDGANIVFVEEFVEHFENWAHNFYSYPG